MNGDAAWRVAARMDSLPQLLALLQALCAQHGVAAADSLRLTLVVEELFTNTVHHGHAGQGDAAVRVQVDVSTTHLNLHYEDEAPPFDPLQQLAEPSPHRDLPTDERPVGGLGLALVAELVERFDYARAEGRNRLQLCLRRQG